jgi:predicted dehydrogenase
LPVFVEKPPCATTEVLSDLVELAEAHRVTTGVGLNFHFAHPIARTRSILNSPTFGGLAHPELRHLANKPRVPMWNLRSLARSFLLAQTIHASDLSIAFDGTIVEIEADVDEIIQGALISRVRLRFASGATASILSGSAFPALEMGLTAISRKHGVMMLDNFWSLTVRDESGGAFQPGEKRWSEIWAPGPLKSGQVIQGDVRFRQTLQTRSGQPDGILYLLIISSMPTAGWRTPQGEFFLSPE